MAKQTINIGASPNDGTGTPLRTSFDYCNLNFTEIYTALGGGVALPGATTQVIFNDGGTNLAGDAGLTYNKTTDALTVAGALDAARLNVTAATIPANGVYLVTTNKIGFSTNSIQRLNIDSLGNLTNSTTTTGDGFLNFNNSIDGGDLGYVGNAKALISGGSTSSLGLRGTSSIQFSIAANLGMTLNSTGLGIGGSPSYKLDVAGSVMRLINSGATADFFITDSGTTNGNVRLRGESNAMKFITGGGVSATIDSSGNVGVGVTPSALWNAAFKAIQIGSAGYFSIASQNTATSRGSLLWNAIGSGDEAFVYRTTGDAANRFMVGSGFFAWYTAASGTAGNAIPFTQAMTLDASGRLLIGKTASALSTVGLEEAAGGFIQSTVTSDASLFCNRLATDGETIKFYRQTVQVGNISVTTTATAYNTSSDYRLKESVKPISGGLARVNALKPSVYNWKSDGSAGEGFLAHELAEVVPAAVTGEKDAVSEDGSIKPQGVDMSRVVPILVAAIQELTARVQTLEAR